jgi:dTDP-4-amino-4,6-dideoxygalactose transaminase
MKITWSGRSHDFDNKDIRYLVNVIKKADPLTQGKYLKKFEHNFGNYIKSKNVLAVSSAASALEMIASIINLKKNDEVIVPSHTYCASAIPFARNGAKLIWSDIDFKTRVVDLNDVKKKITKNTKAIIFVHLYGYAVDISPIKNFLKRKRIIIIEDCAQALGAEIKKNKVGIQGDFACYSFHAQKNITTLGEGGMLYFKNTKLRNVLTQMRHNGHCDFDFKRNEYWLPAMGNLDYDLKNKWPFKYTLSEIQCAAGVLMLKKLNNLNSLRIKRAKKAIKILSKFKELSFNDNFENKRHVYHLLSAYVKPTKKINRNKLIKILFEKYKIKCAIQYYPLNRYNLFKKNGFGKSDCPNTDEFFDNMISFPFHVWMKDKEFNYLVNSIKKALIELDKTKVL